LVRQNDANFPAATPLVPETPSTGLPFLFHSLIQDLADLLREQVERPVVYLGRTIRPAA
jgi:hypothetical protein